MKRKTILLAAALIALSGLGIQNVSAHRYSSKSSGHPIRLIAYPVHALGWTIDKVVQRPIHYFVSQPTVAEIVGHQPRLGEEDTYFENTYPDYTPTIKDRLAVYNESERRNSDN